MALNLDERIELFNRYLDKTGLEHKKYQHDGVRWILNNELRDDPLCGVRGGFIADEMGLGKTIMMIGTFFCNFLPKTLIVVPPILVEQWRSQIYKTTGHKPLVYYGPDKKKITAEELSKAIIVITSYELTKVKRENLLHKIDWDRIVFDEAHHLRNGNTKRNEGARALSGKIRWLVSGTPIQNKKQDFYSLCAMIGLPASFYTEMTNLRSLAAAFILKRTKRGVGIAMVPIVVDKNIVSWKNQREMEIAQKIHSLCSFNKNKGKGEGEGEEGEDEEKVRSLFKAVNSSSPLALLLRARQACIYPKLLMNSLLKSSQYIEALTQSSKLDFVIQKILERKGNGCGKLIFCHFRGEMDEILKRLVDGGISSVAQIDGRVSAVKRANILRDKNEVIILQIQTGCEGLNLQENYSEIYFVSPHWNPAIEDQAVARCHRIGQKKPVIVEHFVMEKFDKDRSVDNYVGLVQDTKRNIVNEYIEQCV
jgi:SNF2 family DNA or RNA helicase